MKRVEYLLERKLIDLDDFDYSCYLPEGIIVLCVKTNEYVEKSYELGEETVRRKTYLYYLEPVGE